MRQPALPKVGARRRIHLDLRAGHLLEPALRHLAWWMFTRSQTQFAVTESELVDQTAAFLRGRGFESETGLGAGLAALVDGVADQSSVSFRYDWWRWLRPPHFSDTTPWAARMLTIS